MFVSPSKIKQNRLLKGRTISFETVKKQFGNLVLIPTLDKGAIYKTIDSTLFRPTQLMALYAKRRIKPHGRSVLTINQKDYYSEMRTETNGRIRKGKTMIAAYNSQNLVYDVYNEYTAMKDAWTKIKGSNPIALQTELIKTLENLYSDASNDPDYENSYLVFPFTKAYENPQRVFMAGNDRYVTDPMALFIASIIRGNINKGAYEKIKMVFFYVPMHDILLAIDIHRPDLNKEFPLLCQRLRRLNGLFDGSETVESLSDDLETDDTNLSKEDQLENKKEEIKQMVLKDVAKTIHANTLTDFEAASRDEKDLMISIDKKIDDFITKPENMKKTVADLSIEIQKDSDIKLKAIRYIETKKANTIKSETLGKELEKEAEIIGSLQDLDDDSNKLNTGKKFKVAVPYMDERVTSSHLASIDSEYEKKQSITDLTNVISAFSTSEVSPLSVDSISIEDSSNQFQEVKTLNVRYKTDEGKPLSFSIDVPKMVDDKYLYLGGDKKVIKKQMVRLPIVKTTPNRVELTSNYAKMTIERTSGKLSRRNSYLLRKLKEVENNKAFEIEYGDNSVVNSKLGYSNDFEYEELASTILKIKSGKYYLCFNRDDMQDETDLLDIPDDFLGSTKTPLGLEKVSDETKALIYIENTHIYKYDLLTNKSTEIKDSMFNFLVEDVLKLDMNNLPTIGRSFIYTKVKFLATTYPLLAVAASQDGLTNILKRYNVKYYFTQKSEKRLDYIEVKFKDKYLHYEDLMKNTLLLNALSVMNTQDYEYSMFDADIPYTHYFINLLGPSVGMHTRNTLRINLDVFIDPITKDILRDLKQPTNIIDVLLYANTLLVGNQYKPLNDLTNYRFRSNEIVNDVLYKIIAEAYVNYQKHKINGKPINLSVNKGQLIKELVELPNINGKSTLNPIIELENIAQSSAKGFRGVNINSAYTLEMRAYDESMNGFLSANATPYSGQTSITRSISYDPKITSVRGYVPKIDQNEISATNMLDPAELLSSFTVAGADSPRQAINLCCPI